MAWLAAGSVRSRITVTFTNDIYLIPAFQSFYDKQAMVWLFIYVLAISLYDLHKRRIPNWYTIPLIAAGFIAHFPGHIELWLASFFLLSAWTNHWIGAGDVKLWIALLWALPVEYSSYSLLFLFVTFFITGLVQIIWRIARKQLPINSLTPGAWRTIPFILLCWYVH